MTRKGEKKKSRRQNKGHRKETGNDTGNDMEVNDPESDGRSVLTELADLEKEEASGEAGIISPSSGHDPEKEEGSGEAGVISPSSGHDTWLSIARGIGTNKFKPNIFSGGIVTQYSIQNTEEAPAEGKLYQGSFRFQHDIDASTSTECSFLIAEDLNHAKEIYKSSIAVSHEGIAKSYFYTYCIPLKKHVVVYEPLEYYKMESIETICFSSKSIKSKWLVNIRNIFGSLESLHTMRLSHPRTSDTLSYMWSKGDPSKCSTRLVGASGHIGKDGRIDDSGLTERNERQGVLSFLEQLKITDCEDYPSLKKLVKQSLSGKTILGHPLLIEADADKIMCYHGFQQRMYELTTAQANEFQRKLDDQFPGLATSWKDKIKSNNYLKSLKVDRYKDTILDLLSFVRNLIEHKRDDLLYSQTHINSKKLVSELSSTFPTFFGWVYTYLNLV